MNTLIAIILTLAAGYLLGRLHNRLRRIPNPEPHQAADAHYNVAKLNGQTHAFTDEAIFAARARAMRLKL